VTGVRDEVIQAGVVLAGDLLVLEGLEDALDRGDDDVARAEHPGAGELVDVVDLGESPPIAGGAVVLELGQGLVGEVVAVDEKEDAGKPAEPQQPVCRGDGREGLAGSGGHLDQGTVEVLVAQAVLDAVDRGDLRRAQRRDVELWKAANLGPPRRSVGVGVDVAHDSSEGAGLGKVEDPPGAGVGVVTVREVGLGAACLKHKGQPALDCQRPETDRGRQTLGIHGRLPLHPGQARARRLGLDDANGLLVDVEQVVRPAMPFLHDDLATGHALRGKEVEVLLVLHRPPGVSKLAVDEHARTLLRRQPLNTGTLAHRAQDTYICLGDPRFACLAQEAGR